MMKRIWKYTGSLFFRGRKALPSRVEAAFDRHFYLATNEDVRESGMDPWRHFSNYGWQEGRKPHPSFDVGWYLKCNPDVAVKGDNPFEHFILYGWDEGRQPIKGIVCDRMAFLEKEANPAQFNPINHLVSVNGDYHDWSAKIRNVADKDLDAAIELGSVWKRKRGGDKALSRIRLGELLVLRGDLSEAAEEFEEALAMEPEAHQPLVLLAECAIRVGDWPKFEEVVSRLEKADSNFFKNPDETLTIARLNAFRCLRDGRLLEAWASFDRLTKADPMDELGFLGRGLALKELKSGEESFEDLWRAFRIYPKLKHARDLLSRLRSEFFNDKGSGAGSDLSGIFGDWENDPPAEILEKLGRLDSGDAASPAVLRLKAQIALAQGNVEGALENLTALASFGPLLRETRCLKGRIHARQDDLSRAMTEFEALLEEGPTDPYLRLRILELSDRMGGRDHRGVCLRPEDSLEMGRALIHVDCFDAAVECFEESVVAEGDAADRAEGLSRLARCQLKTGHFLQARETALKALEISPGTGDGDAVAGAVCRRFGDLERMICHFRSAINLGPQERWIYRDLAAELDRSGDREAAIRVLESGLEGRDRDPELDRDCKRLMGLRKLHGLSESISKDQSEGRPVSSEREEEIVSLLREFIDADWPVIGRDLAECRVCMDEVIRKGENWQLHVAYGDLLVRCGNKFDALGYYEEAHRTSTKQGAYGEIRPILGKIIAILEQLELYERCLSYLEQFVHGLPVSACLPEYRRLACYSAMLGKRDHALGYWHSLRNGIHPGTT